MSRLTRDGTAEPGSRDQIVRHARRQGNIISPVQLTTSRIGNLTRLIHTVLYVMTIHTYILSANIRSRVRSLGGAIPLRPHGTPFPAFCISLMQTTVVCIVYNYDGVAGVDTHAHIWLCRTMVGVEKRGAYRFVYDDLPIRQHSFDITLRFTGPDSADSRQ